MNMNHIPLRGGRVVKVSNKRVVRKGGAKCGGAMMKGSGNLEKLRNALERLKLKEKKYVKF